jgi:hypothetical protein
LQPGQREEVWIHTAVRCHAYTVMASRAVATSER